MKYFKKYNKRKKMYCKFLVNCARNVPNNKTLRFYVKKYIKLCKLGYIKSKNNWINNHFCIKSKTNAINLESNTIKKGYKVETITNVSNNVIDQSLEGKHILEDTNIKPNCTSGIFNKSTFVPIDDKNTQLIDKHVPNNFNLNNLTKHLDWNDSVSENKNMLCITTNKSCIECTPQGDSLENYEVINIFNNDVLD